MTPEERQTVLDSLDILTKYHKNSESLPSLQARYELDKLRLDLKAHAEFMLIQ